MGDDKDTNAMCSRHKFVVNWPVVPIPEVKHCSLPEALPYTTVLMYIENECKDRDIIIKQHDT